jgi:hypothetical protein
MTAPGTCETPLCVELGHLTLSTYRKVALEMSRQGLMSGPVRSARIAAAKRAGKQASCQSCKGTS